MIAYYGERISPHMTYTPDGYLICHDVPIARTGKMHYLARELQLDGSPDRRVTVTRNETDVFDPAVIASFEGKPVTDNHPPECVTSDNYANYAKGHIQNVHRQDNYLVADLLIADPGLIQEVQSKGKREISCGYSCIYEPNRDGTYAQRNIRGNHVAIVLEGRAGPSVSIQDSNTKTQCERSKTMKRSKAQGLLSLFGRAVKDAAPEDLEQITQDAEAALAAVTAGVEIDTVQDTKPLPDSSAVEAKLDKLILLFEQAAAKPTTDTISPVAELDKAIAERKNTVTTGIRATMDSTAILAGMRPTIADIEDEAIRNRVAEALLKVIGTVDTTPDILEATRDSAKNAAAVTVDYAAQQAAYDIFNPHKEVQ